MSTPAPQRPWDRALVALLAVAALWPFLPGLSRGEIPGQREMPIDGAHTLYIYAVVGDALRGATSIVHPDAMWFPIGRPFLLAVQNVVDAVLAQPFLALFGPQLGYALFAAALMMSNVAAAGVMGERVGGRGWSAPAAAMVAAFCPYLWAEVQVGRTTQTAMGPMFLAAAAAWQAVEGQGLGKRAGAWLGLSGLVYWFYGAFGGVVVAAIFLGGLVDTPARRLLLQSAVRAALVAAAVAAPFALFTALNWEGMAGAGSDSPIPNSTRLFSGFFWLPHSRIVAYIPQALYLLPFLALATPHRGRMVGLIVAVLLLCLTAMGEYAQIGGVRIPTPLLLLQALPGFSRFWWPHRALAAATVGLAVAAAAVAARPGWARRVAAVVLLVSAAQASTVPGPLTSWRVPPKPAWDAELPPGPVLTLPMLDPEVGKARFAEWVWHRRPLVNGMSMWDEYLWPAGYRAWAEERPLLRALLFIERRRPHGRKKPVLGGEGDQGARPPPTNAPEPPLPDLGPEAAADLAAAGIVGVVAEMERTPKVSVKLLTAVAGEPTCDAPRRVCSWRLSPP